MCSLDIARRQMAVRGKELLEETLALSFWAREALAQIEGLRLLGYEWVGSPGCADLDPTKLVINVQGLGLSGYEAEVVLREKYQIQVELSDLYNVLILITIGDNEATVTQLVRSFQDMAYSRRLKNVVRYCPPLPAIPEMALRPREAFYSETKVVDLEEAVGEVSAEMITVYPPGIPLICPGEIITQEMVNYIEVLKQEHAELQGPEDPAICQIKILKQVLTLVKTVKEVG
jgi:arginine decarboxylase